MSAIDAMFEAASAFQGIPVEALRLGTNHTLRVARTRHDVPASHFVARERVAHTSPAFAAEQVETRPGGRTTRCT